MAVTQPGRRAVFLDKDGTLLTNVPYNVDLAKVEVAPGVLSGLKLLHRHGFALIVVSNQSGVARGYFGEEEVRRVGRHLTAVLASAGVPLLGYHYCPHLEDAPVERYAIACGCRKPQPGLLRRAAERHDVDLRSSWMIGDILDDVEAGSRAGCRTILLDVGNETEWQGGDHRSPDHRAEDMHEAAEIIVRSDGCALPTSAARAAV